VLRLVVRQTEGGENLDADLVERAKAIIARYDQATTRGQRARSDPLPQGAFGMKSVRTEAMSTPISQKRAAAEASGAIIRHPLKSRWRKHR